MTSHAGQERFPWEPELSVRVLGVREGALMDTNKRAGGMEELVKLRITGQTRKMGERQRREEKPDYADNCQSFDSTSFILSSSPILPEQRS